MKESRIERHLRSEIQALGFKMYKLNPTGQRGTPDNVLFLYHPDSYLIETKRPDGKLKIEQIQEKAELKEINWVVLIINTMEKANDFINSVKRYKSHPSKFGYGEISNNHIAHY